MNKKEQDLEFGLNNEKIVKPMIEKCLKCKLKKTKSFFVCDFQSDEFDIELKSRRIEHSKYNDVKLGNNKIKYFEKSTKKCFIFYYFTDGLYYIEYNKSLFDTFIVKNEKFVRDNVTTYSDNIYIPTHLLKKVL
jgi:hypothetical protein